MNAKPHRANSSTKERNGWLRCRSTDGRTGSITWLALVGSGPDVWSGIDPALVAAVSGERGDVPVELDEAVGAVEAREPSSDSR